ncbi:hypothetical protein AMECASPLE_021444 [Ameca splendens]|uniref:Uncharacterized protein n=1 Tax=Ameca splendens TaxID=208324 RepID=A0ABV1A9X9_9TELE
MQFLEQQRSPISSHYPPYVWYNVLFVKCCVDLTPNVMGHKHSRKFYFCLISPQNILSLPDHQMFCGKCETDLCVLFCQQWFWAKLWTLTLTETTEACRALDVVQSSFG